MKKQSITSAEAARLLGVSPSSIKRWADTGLLECLKTPGRHRRFDRAVVERFASRIPGSEDPAVASAAATKPALAEDSWLGLLLEDRSPHALDARLAESRARLGAWWMVADSLAPLLTEIGERWRTGRLDILGEHEVTERLARALGRVAAGIPVGVQAPLALLTVAEEEEHTLGLSLLEVCLLEAGFRVKWSGRWTPMIEVLAAIEAKRVHLVALSASEAYEGAEQLAHQATTLDRVCAKAGVGLLLGGRGPWPGGLDTARRLVSFAELHRLLEGPYSRTITAAISNDGGKG